VSTARTDGPGYRYVAVYRCTKCKARLSNHELMYSSGVCPYCGHVTPTRGTVCDYEKSVEQIDEPRQHEPQPSSPTRPAMLLAAVCLCAGAGIFAAVSYGIEAVMHRQSAAYCETSCAARSVRAAYRTRGPVVCVCGDGTVELSKH
jgi:predicted RNA-binding Zn-ribbon protein involved in translation (DUF1610 family)